MNNVNNAVTSLRQAKNFVLLRGKLEENNLKREEVDGNNIIRGDLIIAISDTEKYRVNYYTSEFTSKGAESKSYKCLSTVIDEYVSRATALANGIPETEVSDIEIKGNFSINDYVSKKDGTIHSEMNIKSMFVSRIMENYEPCATFDVELYCESFVDEVEDDIPTGRVIVNGIVPIYNGQVIPLTFYTATDNTYVNVGEYIKNNYETGKTVSVRGKLNCTMKTTEYTREGFGAPAETKTFTRFDFEAIIYDGDPHQYLITDPKTFNKKDIETAMLYRNEQLENKKNSNSITPSDTNTTGFASGFASVNEKELNF